MHPTKAIWQANHMKTQIEKSKKFGYNVKGKAAIWQANHMKTQIEKSKKFGYNVKGKAAIWQANHMKTQIEKSKKFGYNVKGKAVKESRFNNNKRQEQQQNFVDFKSIMEYQAKIVNGLMGLKTDKIREWGAEVIEGN